MSAGGSPGDGSPIVGGGGVVVVDDEEDATGAVVLEADAAGGAELALWHLPVRFTLRGLPPGMRMRFWPGGVVDCSALAVDEDPSQTVAIIPRGCSP